jgi:hypothetical protein
MSSKKTLIVAVLFALIVGGFVYDKRRRATVSETRLTEGRLIVPKGEDLTGLTLRHPTEGDVTIRLVKEDKHWKLAEPVRGRADISSVQTLIDQLDRAQRENPFKADKAKLHDYGLSEPSLTVEVSTGDETKPSVIQIGDKTPDENSAYARLGDSDEVFTLSSSLVRTLGIGSMQLRDKRLLPANLTEATTIALTFDGQTHRLERRDGAWEMIEPIRGEADANAVSTILSQWNNAKAGSFIDQPGPDAEYGLDDPVLTASVYVDGDDGLKTYTMQVGDVNSTVTAQQARYARMEGEATVFPVKVEVVKKLQPTLDDLRSKDLFTIAAPDVGRFDLRLLSHNLPMERDEGAPWRFRDAPATELDQAMIDQKLSSLVRLKAIRFFPADTPTATTGLGSPNVTATVWSADGATSQTIQTGRKAEDGDWVYCRFVTTGGRDEIVGVDWTRPGQFMLTREDVLDKSIFRFDADAVGETVVIDEASSMTLTRTEAGAWNGVRYDADKPAGEPFTVEPALMSDLLISVVGLEWKRMLDPDGRTDRKSIEQYRLNDPPRRLIFRDADGLELGALGQGYSSGNYAFVTADTDLYYRIELFRFDGFHEALRAVAAAAGARLNRLENLNDPEPMDENLEEPATFAPPIEAAPAPSATTEP